MMAISRLMTLIDEFTRECLAIGVARRNPPGFFRTARAPVKSSELLYILA